MMRLSPWVCLLALAVLGLWVPDCEARGGGGRGGGGFSRAEFEQVDVPAVEFTENIPAATEASVKEDKPFLVFFCTQEMAKYAGMGSRVVRDYRKEEEKRMMKTTPLEVASVVNALNKSNYKIVKVIAAPQTASVARKYKVTTAPALVACAPNSDVIGLLQGEACSQTNVLKMLSEMENVYAQWKKRNPDKVEKKAEKLAEEKVPPPAP